MKQLLKFSPGNAKIPFVSLSLLSGHTCPFADQCLAKVNLITRELEDGPNQVFRCFSAIQERQYPNTFKQRKHNMDLLFALKNDSQAMAELILASIPKKTPQNVVRIHVAGDFFNQKYFDAWMLVAKQRKDLTFYGYTKSTPYLTARLNEIPENLVLVASQGGRKDSLIKEYSLKTVSVVFSNEEAAELGLTVDHDDSNAFTKEKSSFALLVHGTQKKGSKASKAWEKVKKTEGGYSMKNRKLKEAA